MTRKDYVSTAAILRKHMDENDEKCASATACRLLINDMSNDFSDMFIKDNPRFDKHIFKVACGLIP